MTHGGTSQFQGDIDVRPHPLPYTPALNLPAPASRICTAWLRPLSAFRCPQEVILYSADSPAGSLSDSDMTYIFSGGYRSGGGGGH